MRKETKLGLFILLGLSAMMVSILSIKNIRLARGYHILIDFDEVSGLLEKSWVRVAGVKVGMVDEIMLYENKARVKVWLKKGLRVHRDAKANIVSTGVLGVKYLDLVTGTPGEPLLKEGEVITGVAPVSLDTMFTRGLDSVDALAESLKGFTGKGAVAQNLNELLENANQISKKINVSLSAEKLQKFVSDMSLAADSMKKLTSDLAEITSEEKTDLKAVIKNLKLISEKLDRVLTDISKGDTTLGKLMSDREMGEDLKKTFSSLKDASNEAKKTLARFTLFKTYWDYEMRYSPHYSEAKSDAGILIKPKPDKFYYLGIANAGLDDGKTPEKRNTFNLKLGKDVQYGGNKLGTVYAGVLRSSGGLGLGVRPFYRWNPWNRLEIYSEAYDFSRTTPAKEVKPRVIAGARVYPARWLRVGGSIEDVSVDKDLHIAANVTLEDEDLAYLLALIGLSR